MRAPVVRLAAEAVSWPSRLAAREGGIWFETPGPEPPSPQPAARDTRFAYEARPAHLVAAVNRVPRSAVGDAAVVPERLVVVVLCVLRGATGMGSESEGRRGWGFGCGRQQRRCERGGLKSDEVEKHASNQLPRKQVASAGSTRCRLLHRGEVMQGA